MEKLYPMKFNTPYTLKSLASFLDKPFIGPENLEITGINEIHQVQKGDVVFVDHPKYYKKALESKADVILIDQEVEVPKGKGIIISEQPFDDFNKITLHHSPFSNWNQLNSSVDNIHQTAVIAPNVFIGHNVTVGANTIIHAGATIADNSLIGEDVIIGPNAVIGHDAFYYKKKQDGYHKMHSCGRVILENRVEIGALSTIDKGVTGDTVIGEGTKLDNHVHIGHDTIVGQNCLFAANVGVAGCVIIENNVTLWGQVGVTSDITIGEGAVVQAQSGVSRSLKGGRVYFGSPATDARTALKEMAAVRKLPSIIENL